MAVDLKALTGSHRLLFEKLHADHAQGLFDALCNERVYEHIGDLPAKNAAELAFQFSRMALGPPPDRAQECWLNYALRIRSDGSLIGWLQATVIERRAEVAYLLDARLWGQGYATEAMSEFQNHLRYDAHITEFWATTTPQNERSIQLLSRLGYEQVLKAWPQLLSYDDGDLVFVLR